jgi:membrane-associated phospholipid phosphatase
MVVVLSTLFTRQHYLLDLLGGLAIAWLGYRFGIHMVPQKA